MTRFRLAASLLLTGAVVLGAAHAQVRDASPAVPVGTASIEGVVRSGGEPLRRASVSIGGDMRLSRTVVTGEDGRFRFDSLPAGRFTITATKGGYPPMSYGASRPYRAGSGVLLEDGALVDDVVLDLERGAVLTGTLYDDHGQPMTGVPVMSYEVRTTLAGERTFDMPPLGGGWVMTDDRGQYRIYGLPPGDYTVGTAWHYHGEPTDATVPSQIAVDAAFQATASAQSGIAAPATAEASADVRAHNYTPIYHPSAVDPLDAVTIPVEAGDVRDGIDIHMQFRPMARITGQVTWPSTATGAPRIALFRRSPVQAVNTTSYRGARPDGTFETSSLAPSDYTVMAFTPATDTSPAMWASQDVTISGPDPQHVALMMQPAMTMTGRMAFSGATLAPPDPTTVRLGLPSWPGTSAMNSTDTKVNADGTFAITGVTPGRFRLTTSIPSSAAPGEPVWHLRAVVADGRDVTDLPIDVVPGRAPAVEVTFTDEVSELSGLVVAPEGQAPSGYFVVVLPADRAYWATLSRRIASARPDSSGRYVFRGLPGGDYLLAATTDLVPDDLRDTVILARLAEQGLPVTLDWGERRSVDLRMGQPPNVNTIPPAIRISLRVPSSMMAR